MKRLTVCLLLLLSLPARAAEPDWQPWGAETFRQAAEQEKYVFLYLEAVWCHWCHVMQGTTLKDAAVLERLQAGYLAVRVDHDSHPALANRYRAWGWPALIFLAPDGTEIVKRAGHIAPGPFARLLDAIVRDPSPEVAQREPPEPAASSLLGDEVREALRRRHLQTYDTERGGLALAQKFIERDSLEYALVLAAEGDAEQGHRVRQTLDAARALIDPVWGGVYQYSTGGRWDRPHYEKIMRSQAGVLRSYALGYALFGRESDKASAEAIRDYLLEFLLSPEGAFYASQDADLVPGQKAHDYFVLGDAERRRRGIPRIDQHRYAQENGQAIEALAYWHEVSGDERALRAALRAADWVLHNRRRDDGGFSHGSDASAGPFLGDNIAMVGAFLQLYRSTADRRWLALAAETANFLVTRFKAQAGFNTAASSPTPVTPVPVIEENIAVARLLNLLSHYTGREDYREAARHAMRYLAAPGVALSRITEAGILLAERELAAKPAHFAVVGDRGDPVAAALHRVARHQPGWYKRIEWWDRREGPLPNDDVRYPNYDRPAGYICRDSRCSAPSFSAPQYRRYIDQLTRSE